MKESKTTLPEAQDKNKFVQDMFNRIAKRYNLMNTLLTFGLDRYWRSKTLKTFRQLSSDQTNNTNYAVLDLACGTGDFILSIQKRAPKENVPKIVGVDFSEQMLVVAKNRIQKNSKPETGQFITGQLICGDLEFLPLPEKSFDGAVMGFALRNLTDIPATFKEIARVLKPGAPVCILEVGIPKNPILKFLHSFYFGKLVPLIGRLLSDSTAYKYLPQSVAFLPTSEKFEAILKSVGFEKVRVHQFTGNVANLTTANRIS